LTIAVWSQETKNIAILIGVPLEPLWGVHREQLACTQPTPDRRPRRAIGLRASCSRHRLLLIKQGNPFEGLRLIGGTVGVEPATCTM